MLSDHKSPILSVVIPVYNVADYLSRCLDSVVNQSFKSLEIIVVNDGSTDDSATIIARYASDPRVIVVEKENGGLVSARRAGLERATGKYIHHLDGDDYLATGAYEALINKIEQEQADILLFPFLFDYEGTKEPVLSRPYDKEYYASTDFLQACYTEKGYFAVWHYIHKRALYDQGVDFNMNLSLGEDAYLTTQLVYYANKIVSVSGKPYLHYVIRTDSITNQHFSKKKISDFLLYPELIDAFLKNKPEYPLLGSAIASLRIHSLNNIVNAGYLMDIRKNSEEAMVLYGKYPELIKQRSTKTYYKLFYLYHLNPLLGYLYSLYYKRKGKIKKIYY